MRGKFVHGLSKFLVRVRVTGYGCVQNIYFRGMGQGCGLSYGFGVRGKIVNSRDCALASLLVKA